MGFLDGLFGPSTPTPEERRQVRKDNRKTRKIVGGNDTGTIADAKAARNLSIHVTQDVTGGKTAIASNSRPGYWPGQRISETEAYESGETPKGSLGW